MEPVRTSGYRPNQALEERLASLEEEHRCTLDELGRSSIDIGGMRDLHRATLNLLEDFETERLQYQQTQRALLNILEDVEDERLMVERTKARLEASHDELEAFSYSISHDLRAPLRAIIGLSRAVLEDCSPRLSEEGRRYLTLIHGNALRMSDLIDSLLEFSRLGSQDISLSRVDLGSMVRTAFDEVRGSEPQRNISLLIGPVPMVQGDATMLRQAMINLVSNAFKYTRQREQAIIEFGHRAHQYEDEFFIRDNGAGFDMRYVDMLFRVFSRLHSTSEFEGTGVGLALVKRIIERHGGRIWAEGEVDGGATFHFTIPGQRSGSREGPR